MIEMVLNTLPKIAAEIAAPLSNVASIKIVSGEGGEVGISRITGEVIDIMGKLPETIDKLTGINITKVSSCVAGSINLHAFRCCTAPFPWPRCNRAIFLLLHHFSAAQ